VTRYRYAIFFVRLRNVLINKENRSAILQSNRMSLECNIYYLFIYLWFMMGRDSAVGVTTRYGLDGPGIESRWMRVFPHPSRLALEPIQPPVQCVSGLFNGDRAIGA
jgi:hypothetical protein